MSTIPYHIIRERIFFEEESRLLRVYTSPATPAKVLVPESQAERILSNETNLLKPEDVFAALLALPEQRILRSVVLLDERDEIARKETHPTWPAAHKSYSYGGGREVCFHGVSKSDDPVAILNYHWAKEQFVIWDGCTFPAAFRRAMWIELNRHIYDRRDIEIDWAVHMAGDILAKETEKFERFAACAPLRTVALCRGLRLSVDVEGNPPLADWLARRAEDAETRVKVAARQQLVEIANTSTDEWRRDDAICLLLHYGEAGDFRSLAGTRRLRLTADKVPAEMLALLAYMDFLEELDLSYLETDWYSACYILSKCPRLKKLKLKRSPLFFSGALSALHYFKSLTDLDLAETLINDGAVPYLTAKKGLKRIDIRGTGISEEGIAQLRRELPSCEIITAK